MNPGTSIRGTPTSAGLARLDIGFEYVMQQINCMLASSRKP